MCINFNRQLSVSLIRAAGAAARPTVGLGGRTLFRNILVHIPSERPVRPVIDVAVALTLARRSHLDAVAIGYESMSAVGMVVEGGGAAVAAVLGVELERAMERANAAISVFEVEARPRSHMASVLLRRAPPRPRKPSAPFRGFTTSPSCCSRNRPFPALTTSSRKGSCSIPADRC